MSRPPTTAYLLHVDEHPSHWVAFVPFCTNPNNRRQWLWMRTEACALLVACPNCGSTPGMLCRSARGSPWGSTHSAHRDAFRKMVKDDITTVRALAFKFKVEGV
jgi:hypothetical protein